MSHVLNLKEEVVAHERILNKYEILPNFFDMMSKSEYIVYDLCINLIFHINIGVS